MKILSLLNTVCTGLVLAVAFFVVADLTNGSEARRTGTRASVPVPAEPLPLNGAELRGARTAPVALVMFSDFECAFCARFWRNTFPVLKQDIADGRLVIAFRHFFIESLHPGAFRLAKAAHCSGAQGRFWDLHDRLIEIPLRNERDSLWRKAREVGVDIGVFDRCLSLQDPEQIDQDIRAGLALGVNATPTFFVGENEDAKHVKVSEVIVGDMTPDVFVAAVQRILKAEAGNR